MENLNANGTWEFDGMPMSALSKGMLNIGKYAIIKDEPYRIVSFDNTGDEPLYDLVHVDGERLELFENELNQYQITNIPDDAEEDEYEPVGCADDMGDVDAFSYDAESFIRSKDVIKSLEIHPNIMWFEAWAYSINKQMMEEFKGDYFSDSFLRKAWDKGMALVSK